MLRVFKKIVWSGTAWFLTMPLLDLAQSGDSYGLEGTAEGAGLKKAGEIATPLPTLIGNVIKSALSLLGVVFFLLVLYGGVKWMKARGNSQEVEKAKEVITDAVIGLVVIVAAYALTAFVFNVLTQD